MSAGDFFNRWAKPKAPSPAAPETNAAPATETAPELPPPTLEDVAALGHDADFSRFVKPGVDEAVRRSAMKKLFTDPHFNVMDGLDIYIGDYNTFEPLPAAMLAMLVHAKPLLDPLGHLQQPAMKMLERLEQLAEGQPAPGENALQAEDAGPGIAISDTGSAEAVAAEIDDNQVVENPVVGQADSVADNTAELPKHPVSPEDDHTI